MSTPVPNNNAPNSQEQKWWRADIRTFIMNLWFIILLAFGFFREHYPEYSDHPAE